MEDEDLTARVMIRPGIIVELPIFPTPITSSADPWLLLACDALTRSRLPDATPSELGRGCEAWLDLFFELWRRPIIHVWDRLLRRGHPFRLIDFYPPGELIPANFIVEGTRFTYLPTGQMHFDVHYGAHLPPEERLALARERARALAEPKPEPLIKPSPATISLPAKKPRAPHPPGFAERRVKLIHASETTEGWTPKTGVVAEDLARVKAEQRGDAEAVELLSDNHPDTTARAWRAARALRDVADPSLDEIREILRRQRRGEGELET